MPAQAAAARYHPREPSTQRPLVHDLRFTHLPSGARLAWARSGQIGAPVLLRAAHWMTHVEYDLRSPLWRPLIEQLGRHLELVRYDERGCGLSTADDVPLGLDASVEELEAVTQAQGAQRFALLGISGGAATAVAHAARHPERVSHLVPLAGSTHGLLHRNPSRETLAFHETQLRLIEPGWGRKDPGVQQLFTSRFMPDGTAEQIASFNEHQRLSCDGMRAAAIIRARARAGLDVRPLARALRVPTLVLHCEGDVAMPLALGHELAATIPGARFEMLRSRNHLPAEHEPAFERLCQVITEFVGQKPSAPALTPRERELAGLVGQGLDNLQLAARLGLADKTVRNMLSARLHRHAANLHRQLPARDGQRRAAAVGLADVDAIERGRCGGPAALPRTDRTARRPGRQATRPSRFRGLLPGHAHALGRCSPSPRKSRGPHRAARP